MVKCNSLYAVGTHTDDIQEPFKGTLTDHSNAQEILRNILGYLVRGDYKGLYEYLNNLPEITVLDLKFFGHIFME